MSEARVASVSRTCARGYYHLTPPDDSPPECQECVAGDLRVALLRAEQARDVLAEAMREYAEDSHIDGCTCDGGRRARAALTKAGVEK